MGRGKLKQLDALLAHEAYVRDVAAQHARRDDVDDIAQDVLLDLVSWGPSLQQRLPGGTFKSLLFRMRRGRARELTVRKKRYEAVRKSCGKKTNASHDRTVDQKDELTRLMMIMGDVLSPRTARTVTLRFLYGLSVQETAAIMNVDTKTVSRYASVGLARLRAYLRKCRLCKDDCFGG